jgi:hypothetical protein
MQHRDLATAAHVEATRLAFPIHNYCGQMMLLLEDSPIESRLGSITLMNVTQLLECVAGGSLFSTAPARMSC